MNNNIKRLKIQIKNGLFPESWRADLTFKEYDLKDEQGTNLSHLELIKETNDFSFYKGGVFSSTGYKSAYIYNIKEEEFFKDDALKEYIETYLIVMYGLAPALLKVEVL